MHFLQEVPASGRLVDVVCSTGQILNLARQAGYTVSGIEFSDDSRHFAQDNFDLETEPGSIHDSVLAPASIDLMTTIDVIEHVRDALADMAAVFRLLKPGRWFVLSSPNIDGLFPRLSRPLANTLDYWPHPEPTCHLYQYIGANAGSIFGESWIQVGASGASPDSVGLHLRSILHPATKSQASSLCSIVCTQAFGLGKAIGSIWQRRCRLSAFCGLARASRHQGRPMKAGTCFRRPAP